MFKSVFLLSSQHQALVINAFRHIIIILIVILFLNDTKRKKKIMSLKYRNCGMCTLKNWGIF